MFGANANNDKALLKAVTQRLARGTGSQVRATATVHSGTVTISGLLQREGQRIPIVKEISRIAGVRRVIDQFTIRPKNVYPTGPTKPASTGEIEKDAPAAESSVPVAIEADVPSAEAP